MRFGLWMWLPSLLLAVDWAKHRREPIWICVLLSFGPLGAAAYVSYFWESITFPFPLASTFHRARSSKNARKRCSRCAREVERLERFEDARYAHSVCSDCRADLMRSRT